MRLLTFIFTLLVSSVVWAAPCTNMQIQSGQTNIDFSNNFQFQGTLTIKANTQPGGCSFFVVFDYGLSNSYANRSLKMGSYTWPYQISKDAAGVNIIKNFPDVSSNNDVITGILPDSSGSDTQVNVTFWALLNQTNPWLRFGNYTEYISAQLYMGTISNYTFIGSKQLALNYNAAKRVDISVVPTGSAFSLADTDEVLDFGNLTPGATRSCDVVLKYNAGYTLYASSVNGGRLKHQTDAEYIPYTIKFNGSPVTLTTSPTQLFREFGVSPATGTVIPVNVTIGNFGIVKSGTYSDQVLLTVQSTE